MKANKEIPLSVPNISGNEWRYVKDCLDTGWVSSVGSYVSRFEQAVARYVGAAQAAAIVNGTSALHLSLLSCGVCADEEVIVPALTFIAPVNAVRYCAAWPVFMDCDQTLCMDMQKLKDFLEKRTLRKKDGYSYNRVSGRKIRAAIAVHIFGHPVDMDMLIELCREYNIEIIEDAAESLGSEYKGRKTGTLAKAGCFSFNGNKIITSGGGGMVVSNDVSLLARIRHLSTQANTDTKGYIHDEVGYNYRLTNIQAAMGVAQMERLSEYIKVKRENALLYKTLFADIGDVEFLGEQPWARSNFWFYTVRVAAGHKEALMRYLLDRNIQVRPVWKPIHTLPMYKDCLAYAVEEAISVYESCFNIPCSSNLDREAVEFVAGNIKEYFKNET